MSLDRTKQPKTEKIGDIHFIKPQCLAMDNGIPLYVLKTGDEQIVRVDFLFHAGTYFQNQPLVASSTNALLKEGSNNYTAYKIAETLDHYGAAFFNNINEDFATLSFMTLKKHFFKVLPVIADIIKYPVFDERELEIYLMNKKKEFLINSQKVSVMAKKGFLESLFGEEHPYGLKIKEEHFNNLKRGQLARFHKDFYHLANLKIMISGDVGDDEIKLLNDFFATGNWKGETPEVGKLIDRISDQKKIRIEKPGALQSAIRIGGKSVNKRHEDYMSMMFLNKLFGGFFGSRLMKNIREEKGYTYGIYSLLISLDHSGYFCVVSEVGKEYLSNVLEEIYKEIRKLKDEKVDDDELDLVKNYYLGELTRLFSGLFSIVEAYKTVILYGLDFDYYEKFIDMVKEINGDDIRELAKKYLDEKQFIEVVAG